MPQKVPGSTYKLFFAGVSSCSTVPTFMRMLATLVHVPHDTCGGLGSVCARFCLEMDPFRLASSRAVCDDARNRWLCGGVVRALSYVIVCVLFLFVFFSPNRLTIWKNYSHSFRASATPTGLGRGAEARPLPVTAPAGNRMHSV